MLDFFYTLPLSTGNKVPFYSHNIHLRLAHADLNLLKINILKNPNFGAFERYPVPVKHKGTT